MRCTRWRSDVTCLLAFCLSAAQLDSAATQPTASGETSTNSSDTPQFVFDGSATVAEGRVNIRLVVPVGDEVSTAIDAASFTLMPTATKLCTYLKNAKHCKNGATVANIDSCPGQNTWKCPNDDICLPIKYKCDGHEDCNDGADEVGCSTTRTSTTSTSTTKDDNDIKEVTAMING